VGAVSHDVEVRVTGVAAGGDGVGRLDDGRAVFVPGAVPGDRVRARLDETKPRFARATALEVLDAGPGRVDAPCPHVAEGCGGCGWQHVDHDRQRALKAEIVRDALIRLGRLAPEDVPAVEPGPDLPPFGHRTTVRAAVDDEGRAGLRTHRGHDVVPFGAVGCPIAHPLVDEVLRTQTFPGAHEVTVRCGAATGERLVMVDDVPPAEHRWIHDEVAGRRWRISARSFFQARPDGAAALVDAVHAAVAPAEPRRLADLYAGVGLFAGALADRLDARIVAVEASADAVADARVNLADVPGAKVVRADVRRWRPSPADAVVADPSRHGLGTDVVGRIAATHARAVALVSCDPGSLGRDAGLLAAAGYRLDTVTLVDLFPHTPHVEVVSAWRHPAGDPAP
jgi:23S rRNA (uracil1939-C5)-methyltransferase